MHICLIMYGILMTAAWTHVLDAIIDLRYTLFCTCSVCLLCLLAHCIRTGESKEMVLFKFQT